MTKRDTNLGFSIVEALLILAVVGILGFTGWYVYHAKQTSNKDYSAAASATVPTYKKKTSTKTTTTANPYNGWNTYTVASTGLTFKYPANWTMRNNALCTTDSYIYHLEAPESELSTAGAPPVNELVTGYDLDIIVGTAASTGAGCNPISSRQGVVMGAQSSSQIIKSGALQGKYVLVNSDINGNGTDAANGIDVYNSNYGPGEKVTETGQLTVPGTPVLQVTSGLIAGQDIGETTTSNFINSQLYKDTLNIVNSFTTK